MINFSSEEKQFLELCKKMSPYTHLCLINYKRCCILYFVCGFGDGGFLDGAIGKFEYGRRPWTQGFEAMEDMKVYSIDELLGLEPEYQGERPQYSFKGSFL